MSLGTRLSHLAAPMTDNEMEKAKKAAILKMKQDTSYSIRVWARQKHSRITSKDILGIVTTRYGQ